MASLIQRGVFFTFTGLALLAVVQRQPSRDTPASPAVGTGVIAGTIVTDEANPQPLRRVTVNMNTAAGTSAPRITNTDDRGRFAFTGLPAGIYAPPRAMKSGFVPSNYGEKHMGGVGQPITVAEGQQATIALKMTRGAVITGVVFDQNGRPAAQTTVQTTLVRVVNGERSPATYAGGTPSVATDDRGIYRLYGLPPGDYLVAATPRLPLSGDVRAITDEEIQWAQRQFQQQPTTLAAGNTPTPGAPRPAQGAAYAPVYFPGTADVAGATLVTVVSGQERSGVDFSVRLVPTARIEGTIVDQDGRAPTSAQVSLVSRAESSLITNTPLSLETMLQFRPIVVDGKFSIVGVRPGEYTLSVRAAPGAGGASSPGAGRGGPAAAMTLWAMTDVTVDGQDQSDIALHLQPGMTLSGRIVIDVSSQPPPDPSRISIRLAPALNSPGAAAVGAPGAVVAADGMFTIGGVIPGRYLFVSGGAPAAVMKAAMIDGVNGADLPFEVRPGQDISNAVVTFTDKTAELSGTVLDAIGHPTSDLSIFLFPTDRAMWTTSQHRRVRPPARAGANGTFKFTGLVPGEYYLAALSDFDASDIYQPAFLEQVAAGAMKITLNDGEKKVQDLRMAGGGPQASRRSGPTYDGCRHVMGEAREKICEACGEKFACMAGGCWCGEVDVTAAVRADLRARYHDCLCPECLRQAVAAETPAQ